MRRCLLAVALAVLTLDSAGSRTTVTLACGAVGRHRRVPGGREVARHAGRAGGGPRADAADSPVRGKVGVAVLPKAEGGASRGRLRRR
jgi:hypothetical protein